MKISVEALHAVTYTFRFCSQCGWELTLKSTNKKENSNFACTWNTSCAPMHPYCPKRVSSLFYVLLYWEEIEPEIFSAFKKQVIWHVLKRNIDRFRFTPTGRQKHGLYSIAVPDEYHQAEKLRCYKIHDVSMNSFCNFDKIDSFHRISVFPTIKSFQKYVENEDPCTALEILFF